MAASATKPSVRASPPGPIRSSSARHLHTQGRRRGDPPAARPRQRGRGRGLKNRPTPFSPHGPPHRLRTNPKTDGLVLGGARRAALAPRLHRHDAPHGGHFCSRNYDGPILLFPSAAKAAVVGFFLISGYSIAHSYGERPEGYFRRRFHEEFIRSIASRCSSPSSSFLSRHRLRFA